MAVENLPQYFEDILSRSAELDFQMNSDKELGMLLRTLVASKPKGNFLDLGTGAGLSLSWIVSGMDDSSKVFSIESESDLANIAIDIFSQDERVSIDIVDGFEWIENYSGDPFDLIFADTWPGKFYLLDKTLSLLKPGGFYLIDDLSYEKSWPEGHEENVKKLVSTLQEREDLEIVEMNWSTGIILGTKR